MLPQDCATTLDNRRGAVRYAHPTSNAAIVAIYDLVGSVTSGAPGGSLVTHGGNPWKSGLQMDVTGNVTGHRYRPSDRIELTNEWGVSIGTGISGLGNDPDETYIEAFDIGSAGPSSYFEQFEQTPNSSNYDTTRAGYAHDLAITRDAKWAVVNSENWIHLISLDSTTMTATQLPGINIGGLPAGRCNPDGAVDSVAVTNDRAVVTTARLNTTFNTYTTWVYIVDLTPTTGPVILLEHEITPPAGWVPTSETEDDERPHDVIITPTRDGGGDYAVVTTNHATAFYKLSSASFEGSDFESKLRRKYQKQVDSVEASGHAVVTIADIHSTPTAPPAWHVSVYHLAAPPIFQPLAVYQDTNALEDGSRAHDLAIDWDFNVALIRTSVENVIVSNLPTSIVPATAPVKLELPSSADAYAYEDYPTATFGRRVFSSDSVAIGSEQNGSLYGVTIGARQIGTAYIGVADVIDLLAATPSVSAVDILPQSGDVFFGCVPLDLAISFDQTKVVVRSTDTIDQASPTGDGPDLVVIPLAGGTVQRYGGSGTVHATDSLAAPSLFGYIRTNRRIMSISEDPFQGVFDYTHFVR